MRRATVVLVAATVIVALAVAAAAAVAQDHGGGGPVLRCGRGGAKWAARGHASGAWYAGVARGGSPGVAGGVRSVCVRICDRGHVSAWA